MWTIIHQMAIITLAISLIFQYTSKHIPARTATRPIHLTCRKWTTRGASTSNLFNFQPYGFPRMAIFGYGFISTFISDIKNGQLVISCSSKKVGFRLLPTVRHLFALFLFRYYCTFSNTIRFSFLNQINPQNIRLFLKYIFVPLYPFF